MTGYRNVGSPFSAGYLSQPFAQNIYVEEFAAGGAPVSWANPTDGYVELPARFQFWNPSGVVLTQNGLDASRQMGLMMVGPPGLGLDHDWCARMCDVRALFPDSLQSEDSQLAAVYAKLSPVAQAVPALAELEGDTAEGIDTYGGLILSTGDMFTGGGTTQDAPFVSLGLRLGPEGWHACFSKWLGHQNLLEQSEVLIGKVIGALYVRIGLSFDEDDETLVQAGVSLDGDSYLTLEDVAFQLSERPKWIGFGATGSRNDGVEPPLTFQGSSLVDFIRVSAIVPLNQAFRELGGAPGGRAQP